MLSLQYNVNENYMLTFYTWLCLSYINFYNLFSSTYYLFIDKGQVLNMLNDALGKVNQYYILINGLILTGRFL